MGLRPIPGSAWILALAVSLNAGAQHRAGVKDLAAGKLLVAPRELLDPNFARTVVLLLRYDEEGAMGLILNRRTDVALSRVLQEWKEAKGRSDPVFVGGPVNRTSVLALLRSSVKPPEARPVFADVYLVGSKAVLEKTLAAGADSHSFRVYLGYAGWAPGQLEFEAQLDSWHIFKADPGAVFDPDPDSMWQRFIRRTELQIAAAPRPGGAQAGGGRGIRFRSSR